MLRSLIRSIIRPSLILTPEDLHHLLRAYQARGRDWCGPPSREARQLGTVRHRVKCGSCDDCLAANRVLRRKGLDPADWRRRMRQVLEQAEFTRRP